MCRFGFGICIFKACFLSLFYFLSRETKFTVYEQYMHCSCTVYKQYMYCSYTVHILFTHLKILKIGPIVLFTHLKFILLQWFQFLVFSFSNNKFNPNIYIYINFKIGWTWDHSIKVTPPLVLYTKYKDYYYYFL